jgi:hypothetical protein
MGKRKQKSPLLTTYGYFALGNIKKDKLLPMEI